MKKEEIDELEKMEVLQLEITLQGDFLKKFKRVMKIYNNNRNKNDEASEEILARVLLRRALRDYIKENDIEGNEN